MKNKKALDLKDADNRIVTYLEVLLKKKGMENMPPEIISDMIMDLYARFEKFLFLSVMQNLTKEGYKKFDDFIATNPKPEKSLDFLEKNVKDFSGVIRKAMDEFESIYLNEKKTDYDEE